MTKKMKTLAAVDLSDYSSTVVRYSVWLSTKLKAELVLVNVINQRDLDMVHRTMLGYESFSYADYLAEQEELRETQMAGLVKAVHPCGITWRSEVRTGIPYRELLAAIESEAPHLMVIGTKGRSNFADVVVGSTARKLYRRSPIPLVSIPAGFSDLP